MSPLESHDWRPAIHLEHLPRKGGHHALESLVAGCEVRVLRAVEVIGRDDGVVCPDFQHVLGGLRWAAVDGERVVGPVDGSPVGDVALEAGFQFPVLDEVLDEVWEGGCIVAFGFCWRLGLAKPTAVSYHKNRLALTFIIYLPGF